MENSFNPLARVPKEDSVQISVLPAGPYGDTLFRRLMASYLSQGVIPIADIACVVDELAPAAKDRYCAALSAKYIVRDLTGAAGAALRRQPVTDPRFVDQSMGMEGWSSPKVPAEQLVIGYADHPQSPYSPPGYSSRRRGKKAAFRRRMKRMLTDGLTWQRPTVEAPERAMTYYERVGWQEIYEFAIALASLEDDDKKLFDAMVLGATDVAIGAELGFPLSALPARQANVLRALKAPNIARAALLAGILDERKP